jgi:hypothetical protein
MLLKGNPGQTGHSFCSEVLMFIGLLGKMSSCQDFLEKTTPTFRIVPHTFILFIPVTCLYNLLLS